MSVYREQDSAFSFLSMNNQMKHEEMKPFYPGSKENFIMSYPGRKLRESLAIFNRHVMSFRLWPVGTRYLSKVSTFAAERLLELSAIACCTGITDTLLTWEASPPHLA